MKSALALIIAKAKTNIVAPSLSEEETLSPTELVQLVVHQDLLLSIQQLEALLTIEDTDIVAEFKKLCVSRYDSIKYTLLDYRADLSNACNQLFFDTAMIILHGANFIDLLQCLIPCITKEVIIDISAQPQEKRGQHKKRRTEKLKLDIVITDIDTSSSLHSLPIHLSSFKSLVFGENGVFNLCALENYPLEHFTVLYSELKTKSPQLLKMICSHNQYLNLLFQEIAILIDQCSTPAEILSPLANIMALNGTGSGAGQLNVSLFSDAADDASVVGTTAAVALCDYFESLPTPTKENLAACTNASGRNRFDSLISDIKNGECIETNADRLKDILQNPKNSPILDAPPLYSENTKQQIEAKYIKHKDETLVPFQGGMQTTRLPTELAAHFFNMVYISNLDEWCAFLTLYSVTFYEQMYVEMTFNPEIEWALQLDSLLDMLNIEQKQTLVKVLATHWSKTDQNNASLFHRLVHNKPLFEMVFNLLALDTDVSATLQLTDKDGASIVHWAARDNTDTLEFLVNRFSKTILFVVDNFDATPIHWSAQNISSLRYVFEILSPEESKWCLHKKTSLAQTIFFYAFPVITTKLSHEIRQKVITCLDFLFNKLLSPEERFIIATEPDTQNDNLLFYASDYSQLIAKEMLKYFASDRMFDVLFAVRASKILLKKFSKKFRDIIIPHLIGFTPFQLQQALSYTTTTHENLLTWNMHNINALKMLVPYYAQTGLLLNALNQITLKKALAYPSSLAFLLDSTEAMALIRKDDYAIFREAALFEISAIDEDEQENSALKTILHYVVVSEIEALLPCILRSNLFSDMCTTYERSTKDIFINQQAEDKKQKQWLEKFSLLFQLIPKEKHWTVMNDTRNAGSLSFLSFLHNELSQKQDSYCWRLVEHLLSLFSAKTKYDFLTSNNYCILNLARQTPTIHQSLSSVLDESKCNILRAPEAAMSPARLFTPPSSPGADTSTKGIEPRNMPS